MSDYYMQPEEDVDSYVTRLHEEAEAGELSYAKLDELMFDLIEEGLMEDDGYYEGYPEEY